MMPLRRYNLWHIVRNTLRAIRNGELLLRLRADKLFVHILYLFFLIWLGIYVGLKVDKTLVRYGTNKAQLEELRILHAERKASLTRLRNASAVEKSLPAMGSRLTPPKKPCYKLSKGKP